MRIVVREVYVNESHFTIKPDIKERWIFEGRIDKTHAVRSLVNYTRKDSAVRAAKKLRDKRYPDVNILVMNNDGNGGGRII
ncbi:MAG: hypothetical protein KAS32_29440 [Candidatus Peribacteraceae bacterium]|nr:hypothetical protein [Candidatus Peribacteraceae bacterium]